MWIMTILFISPLFPHLLLSCPELSSGLGTALLSGEEDALEDEFALEGEQSFDEGGFSHCFQSLGESEVVHKVCDESLQLGILGQIL